MLRGAAVLRLHPHGGGGIGRIRIAAQLVGKGRLGQRQVGLWESTVAGCGEIHGERRFVVRGAHPYGGLCGCFQGVGYHDGDGLAVVADGGAGQRLQALHAVAPAQDEAGRGQALHILVREDEAHTGNGLGRTAVDGAQRAAADARHREHGVGHAGQVLVRAVARGAAHLVVGVHARRVGKCLG